MAIEQPKIEKPEEETKETKKGGKQWWAEHIAEKIREMQKDKPLREVVMGYVKTEKSREEKEKWVQDMQKKVEMILAREDPEKRIRQVKNILEEQLRIFRTQLEKEEIPSQEKIAMIRQRVVETKGVTEEILKILEELEKELPFHGGYRGNIEYS